MLLYELFAFDGDMMTQLRQRIMDHLTPMVAHNVEFVTIQDIEQTLRNAKTGMTIDRALIMQVLDPNEVKLVKKIEGDRIYLTVTPSDEAKLNREDEQKEREKITTKATNQAKKAIKK